MWEHKQLKLSQDAHTHLHTLGLEQMRGGPLALNSLRNVNRDIVKKHTHKHITVLYISACTRHGKINMTSAAILCS